MENSSSEDKKYTSFELMEAFGIKKGSWFYVRNKYELDKYSEEVIENNKSKFIYSQKAFDILYEDYKIKLENQVKENPQMISLAIQVDSLTKTNKELKELKEEFKRMYESEKLEKEKVVEESHQKDIKLNNLEINYSLITGNLNREKEERIKLEREIERLKSRSLLQRIFNK